MDLNPSILRVIFTITGWFIMLRHWSQLKLGEHWSSPSAPGTAKVTSPLVSIDIGEELFTYRYRLLSSALNPIGSS